MADNPSSTRKWPNRGNELIITASIMATLSTLVAIWRLIVRFRMSKWLGVSDWLMAGGVILNFLACIPYAIFAAQGGQGRLMADPWWLDPARISYEIHMIFICHCLNVYAMFLIKLSVCMYLLALDFGRSYRILIWTSIAVVVLCNFVMMLILHFAYCRPYYSRWDFSVQGECWPPEVKAATAYVQIASNISTDLIFAAAPIIYLRHVKLSKQTQWGVRVVFLLTLIGTGISITKIPMTTSFLQTDEPMWDAIDLSICSINEACIGIIVANLPPLRKTILSLLSHVVPARLASTLGISKKTSGGSYGAGSSQFSSKRQTRIEDDTDDEDQQGILELEERKHNSGIVKTTHVSVCGDGRSASSVSVSEHV
ncbi:hypothetical protein DDE82_002708 [Stemphylium lycopersici]|uniref:Rhodopsin domain-containing protein n=1 Tax=Stemphylium lycopersici TaxID=183478 RepID=A0A364N085_STELY|nr:hypothetical protein TW65_04543 [Stemphylium lycopersici]RAR07734.1 hypothetical protein DDE82_002708 [Stemphylium lycopersici]RAR08514.1 hypothetical protein DDE83_005920 [Stemphylium lycopersici]